MYLLDYNLGNLNIYYIDLTTTKKYQSTNSLCDKTSSTNLIL